MPAGQDLRLLSLDGGGIRGLSSLLILKEVMKAINPSAPPRPCDYFDMIAGTSTGGLIAIMLGRLHMTVDECIDAYQALSNKVFVKQRQAITLTGQVQGRFDSAALEQAIKDIVVQRGLDPKTLLQDSPNAKCKVFVCVTSKANALTVPLRSYRSPRGDGEHLLQSATIWQAGRATAAASTFFDPVAIGPHGDEFVDGATGANNPIYQLWVEAQDMWGQDLLSGSGSGNGGGGGASLFEDRMRCVVSVGTGVPATLEYGAHFIGRLQTLKRVATDTEATAELFGRDRRRLQEQGRYFRFSVGRGLEDVRLEQAHRMGDIAAATTRYVAAQDVAAQVRACGARLAGR